MSALPDIAYPCTWSYRIFGEGEEQLRAAVAALLPEGRYALSLSNRSKGGRYLSLHLEITVTSKEHRDTLFRDLAGSAVIRMVL